MLVPNGVLIKDGDVESAVKAIKALFEDKKLLELKGTASLEKYKKSLTLEKMWKDYETLYMNMLK